ncbi:uncharacterized protein LOC106156645 [Lingula anatina]|uniref:Uncharacterized protein LOC106156645 n=1 Tax=Lingula anatina TaxID=7574 RepID=A0A1S3HN29_LINAN|nr:uncharacterized protein LOC106156645 [Lingula anatina]|eukprot:XP_013387437.1 uncharacterized protein LOC106156645 [Lingula anatina]
MKLRHGTNICSILFFTEFLCLRTVIFGQSLSSSKEREIDETKKGLVENTLSYRLSNISNPRIDFEGCGRTRKSWVCNPAGVLENLHAERLDHMIDDILNSTVCPCAKPCDNGVAGYSVSILVITSIYVPSGSSIFNELSGWGYALANQLWNFGTCGNDIVLVLSRDDDRRLEAYANELVSEKIGGTSCLYKILRGCRPYLFVKNYAAALQYAVISLKKVLLGEKCPEPKNSTDFIYDEDNNSVKINSRKQDNDLSEKDFVADAKDGGPESARQSGLHVEESSNKDGVPGLLISGTFFPWWAIVLIVAGAVLAISLLIAMICCCFGGCGGGRGYA